MILASFRRVTRRGCAPRRRSLGGVAGQRMCRDGRNRRTSRERLQSVFARRVSVGRGEMEREQWKLAARLTIRS